MAWTNFVRFYLTGTLSGTEDRVIAGNSDTDEVMFAVSSTGAVGYYVAGVFTSIDGITLSDEKWYNAIIVNDTAGNGELWVSGQLLGKVTNFPTSRVNQIGNTQTVIYPTVDRDIWTAPVYPRAEGNADTRPAYAYFDDSLQFDRLLTDEEKVDLMNNGSLSPVYRLADYYLDAQASDGLISPQDRPWYLEDWLKIFNQDQRTSAIPTDIGSISIDGEYKTLATYANTAGIWTPTTAGTSAYTYYQAVENYRQILFDASVCGFLLTANADSVMDITGLSPSLQTVLTALRTSAASLTADTANKIAADEADAARVAAESYALSQATAAQTAAQDYADGLAETLQGDIDGKISCYYQATPPTGGTYAEGDLWFDSDDGNNEYRWNGTSWVDVQDTAIADAYDLADDANTLAGRKNTVWGTLALANSDGAVAGDIFLYSGFMYRALVAAPSITTDATKSTRLTPKAWGSLATAPTSGMIASDTYYNSTELKWYYYDGSNWQASSTSAKDDAVTYTPKYLGRYLESHPSSYNNGDWWLVYGLATSTITRGFWYSNNGTPALVTTLSTEAQRKYRASGLEDVLYASNNGYALNGSGVYDPVNIYGIQTMEFLAVNQAFIQKLMVEELKLKSGGVFYGGDRFNADGTIADRSKLGFHLDGDTGALQGTILSDDGFNTLIGTNAGISLVLGTGTNGRSNTVFGCNAMPFSVNGSGNTAIGNQSLYSNLNGTGNTSVGSGSLLTNSTGSTNTAVGNLSLYANTTGNQNSAFGFDALPANTTGTGNTAVGIFSLYGTTSGNTNIGIGNFAGWKNITGSQNIAIGTASGIAAEAYQKDNTLCIGFEALTDNTAGNHQINLNNRIRYFEFPSTATKGTVYEAIDAYLANNVGYSVGAMGRYGTTQYSHICWIHRYSETGIRFLTDGGSGVFEAVDGSADAIGSDLQVTFIAYADIT